MDDLSCRAGPSGRKSLRWTLSSREAVSVRLTVHAGEPQRSGRHSLHRPHARRSGWRLSCEQRRQAMALQLVEHHNIRDTDPRFAAIDRAAFASKNLYNAANYLVRQSFTREGVYLNFATVFHLIKRHEAYCALPRKVSNDVLRQLDRDWRAFFAALDAWK